MAEKKEKKKSSFFADFKKFLSRGNVLDLAVAVIIGAAFGKIVTSLVNDIIMPLVSLAIGGISIADWSVQVAPPKYDNAGNVLSPATTLNYGAFIMTIVDFLIIAFCIFMILRLVMKAQNELKKLTHKEKTDPCAEEKPETPAPPAPPTQEELLTEIRDLLKLQACKDSDKTIPTA